MKQIEEEKVRQVLQLHVHDQPAPYAPPRRVWRERFFLFESARGPVLSLLIVFVRKAAWGMCSYLAPADLDMYQGSSIILATFNFSEAGL